MQINNNLLVKFRKELHKHPELSGKEIETVNMVVEFITRFHPDKIITGIGGNGIVVTYSGKENGPVVLFRADLDALPIQETNDFAHRSVNEGVSHKCGHDGHITILAGLASVISVKRPERGSVVLLFQHAEETGEGAFSIVNDPVFQEINPDYIFALHNIPGFPMHEVIVKNGTFACASKGMIIHLTGKTSHAAEPENGISPAMAVSEIISIFTGLSNAFGFKDYILVTIIHAKLGRVAFGTTPGYAEVFATLRAVRDEDMGELAEKSMGIVKEIARRYKLQYEISWTEEFPATVNNEEAVNIVRQASEAAGLRVRAIDNAFRWSEDFGNFTKHYRSAIFGLGAGSVSHQLHNPDYDFQDELIGTGINLFQKIIDRLLC